MMSLNLLSQAEIMCRSISALALGSGSRPCGQVKINPNARRDTPMHSETRAQGSKDNQVRASFPGPVFLWAGWFGMCGCMLKVLNVAARGKVARGETTREVVCGE